MHVLLTKGRIAFFGADVKFFMTQNVQYNGIRPMLYEI